MRQLMSASERYQLFFDVAHQAVVQGKGFFQSRHLAGVLGAAQFFHQPVGSLAPQTRRAGQGAGKGQADALGLQSDAASCAAQKPVQIRGSVCAVEKDALVVPETPRRVQIAGVRGQPVAAVGGDDQPSGAFVALGIVEFKAREIEAVCGPADEQGVQPAGVHGAAQPLAPGGKNVVPGGVHGGLLKKAVYMSCPAVKRAPCLRGSFSSLRTKSAPSLRCPTFSPSL